jgi:hypothetical protein
MGLLINCPLPTAIGDISDAPCEEHFGQILRIALARVGDIFTDETAFATEAAWDIALAAADDTKVQFTPLMNNVVIPQGEAATIGPDTNETFYGELKVVGKTAIPVTGRFQGLPFAVKKELEAYLSEGASFGNLGVFLIDEFNKVYGIQTGGAATAVSPIPASSFFVGDPGSEGYNTLTYTPVSWNFRGNWVDDVISVTPDFDLVLKTND